MYGLLYVHQNREDFSPSLFLASLQSSTPLSLILLPILSVSLLNTALTSRPSYLAGKEEERRKKLRPILLQGRPFKIGKPKVHG